MTIHLLTNALAAGGLAVLVYVAARFLKQSAAAHLLWTVVLLRLIAPPLVSLPVEPFPANMLPSTAHSDRVPKMHSQASLAIAETAPVVLQGLRQLVQTIWLVGSLAVIAFAARRTLRLKSLIHRDGLRDAATTEQVRRIARESGITNAPDVLLVHARISPMVWAFCCRPILLLPTELWNELSRAEQEAVLKHEMAHIQRRDHWVRVLEFVSTVTHWWCPILWWARRELHWHEERCCDSWAAGSSDSARVALAQACLRTVDFIGEAGSRPTELGVTPMAGYHSIRARLQFILDGSLVENPRRRLSWIAVILAILTLAFTPAVAEVRSSSDASQRPTDVVLAVEPPIGSKRTQAAKRHAVGQTVFSPWKMRAFEQLTGEDLSAVVAKDLHNSLTAALASAEVRQKNATCLRSVGRACWTSCGFWCTGTAMMTYLMMNSYSRSSCSNTILRRGRTDDLPLPARSDVVSFMPLLSRRCGEYTVSQ